MERTSSIPIMDRVRFIGYGLIAGIVIGAIMGWMFHAWIGFLVKLVIVIIFLIPLIAAVFFWRKVTSRSTPARSDVRDADWVEIESSSRTRR